MKLEAIGSVEKDRELDVWHLEHVTCTPAPPGPTREGTEPSFHTWISEGGKKDSLFKADWSRTVLMPPQSGMKRETVKSVAAQGGKGEHIIRVSRGDESDCVAREQNDLQEVFFLIDRARFLLPGH